MTPQAVLRLADTLGELSCPNFREPFVIDVGIDDDQGEPLLRPQSRIAQDLPGDSYVFLSVHL